MNKVVKFSVGVLCTIVGLFSLVACSDKEKDFAAELKLTESYEGRTLAAQGIGEVTLAKHVDGDTIHVYDNGVYTQIRFLAVDTPESTGKVEKWGKTASLFVEERVTTAKKIVIESSTVGSPSEKDTNGRTLGFVWYIPENGTEFRNLNLEVMQAGYSSFQQTAKYEDYFRKANEQAQKLKLGIYSDGEDPNFNDELTEYTLKEIAELLEDDYEAAMGAKVKVEAYVTGLIRSDTYNIRQNVDGEEYNLTLYVGASGGGDYSIIGNKVSFVGFLGEYNNSPQLTGLITSTTNPAGTYTEVLHTGYFLQFDSSVNPEIVSSKQYLYNDVTVVSSEVTEDKVIIVGEATKRSGEKCNVTIEVPLQTGESLELVAGDRISVSGFTAEPISKSETTISITCLGLTSVKKLA